MKKLSYFSRHLLTAALFASVSSLAMAQGYYDDDIYYDASKKKTEKKAQKQADKSNAQAAYMVTGNRQVADYQAADTYDVPATSSLDVDVDAYNRRYPTQSAAASAASAADNGDYTYTQRIERFHNPDIVTGSNDDELKETYAYALQQPQNINVYVIEANPWGAYWGPSWSWGFNSPWYWNSWYGPSYGWGWNSWAWDPYWSWGWNSWTWGPSWSWGGPAWGPGWGPGWGPAWGPAVAWRPSTPSGSSRPHNYVGSGATASHRPASAYAPSSSSRPGNMGRGRYGSASAVNSGTSVSRPGSYNPAANSRPSTGGAVMDNSRPGNSGRGRAAVTNNNSNNNNTNRNSYNSNSSNTYRSSSSSGSFRSSGGGGASRGSSGSHGSSGGGGGRGRR